MSFTQTTKLGLRKPTPGTNEPFNLPTYNADLDKIDGAVGPTVCTSASRPASPYIGQTIIETDTLLQRMWVGSAWRCVGGCTNWVAATRGPQWGAVTGYSLAYRRNVNTLEARGAVSWASGVFAGTTIFNVDALYRPSANVFGEVWVSNVSGLYGHFLIETDGDVSINTAYFRGTPVVGMNIPVSFDVPIDPAT